MVDWTAVGVAVTGAGVALEAMRRVVHHERRLGKFMTREEHEKLCGDRARQADQLRAQMHAENQAVLRDLRDIGSATARVVSDIQQKVAVLEENKRLRERAEDKRGGAS